MEKLSLQTKIVLGMQHVLAMFGATVLVPFLTGLNPSIALICAGVGTLIFHSVTKGIVPVFLGSSFAFIGATALVFKEQGVAILKGGIISAGLVYVIMSFIVLKFGVERIKSLIPIQGKYNYAIKPKLVKNLSEDSLSKLLSVAVEKYQEQKESIANILNDYEIIDTYINNLNSDVYINDEIIRSKDDFMKYTISAMLYEYSDEFSLSKTVEQVFSNPSEYLKFDDDASKKNKVKP